MTDFCVNCNSILELTKKLPSKAASTDANKAAQDILNTNTPVELSDTESAKEEQIETETDEAQKAISAENEAFYTRVLKLVEDNKTLSDEDILKIDVKDMIQTEYYKNLKAKSDIKKKILTLIEDMGNSDENTAFYMFCSNCGYNRRLDPGFHIISKNPKGVPSVHDYIDESKIRNIVHSGVYPRTREFICPNDDCESKQKSYPTEACMLRDGDSYRMIYVCVSCLTIKRL